MGPPTRSSTRGPNDARPAGSAMVCSVRLTILETVTNMGDR